MRLGGWRPRSEWVLAAAVVLASLVALEAGLRIVALLTSHDLSELPPATVRSRRGDLSLGDIIRRSDSRDLLYELRTGLRGRFMGVPVKINAHGFRGRDVADRPAPDRLRIVAIGDSMAFGWGVPEQDTFLSYMARRFRREHTAGPRLEIVNLGVPGYNTHQEVAAFATKGLAFHPDLVVVYLCGNDDQLPNFVWRRDPFTLTRSYLFDFVHERLPWPGSARLPPSLAHTGRNVARRTVRSSDPEDVPPFFRRMVGEGAVVQGLRELDRLTRARGIPVVFAGWKSTLEERMRPVARSLGFRVVEGIPERTREFLESNGRTYESLVIADGHPNRDFHALIGAGFYEEAILPWYEARIAGGPAGDVR